MGASVTLPRKKWAVLVVVLGIVGFFAGCGGNTFNVQNPPPPPASNLSIAFQSTPVSSLQINATTDLTAVVSNDTSNDGVDWSVTCTNANDCGSLNTYHSASGGTVTYTPPQTLPGNNEAVNIVAFATADHTKNALAAITVSAFGSILSGTYVFETKGSDANQQPFQLAGAVVLDGNGGITSGQQTLNYVSGSLTTPIAQGSYFVGPDGRGTMTLKTTNQNGETVTENFSIVVLSQTQALLAESQLDAPQTSSGSMDLQTSTAPPLGSYAFVASGTDSAGTPAGFGGVLNIDSPGSISGKGSLADEDYNNTFTTCTSPKGISGTVSQPSPNPLGTVTITLSGAPCLGAVQFTGYIVDATHIKLIENDNNGSSGFSTAGFAISQGPSTGTFSLASFTGSYVWGLQGQDLASLEPSSLTCVGTLTADGAGNLTDGFSDTLMILSAAKGLPAESSGRFNGTYTIDSKGIGRVRVALKFSSPVPFKPQLIFYLTGSGNPALVLDAGGENLNYPSLGTGIAYPQAVASLSLSGKYAVSFTQQNGGENDGTGQAIADAGTLSGVLDDSGSGFDVPLSGMFGSFDSFGRTAGTFPSPIGSTAGEYYLIDPAHAFFVETDLINPGSGQVGLGYFAPRNPVCMGCP